MLPPFDFTRRKPVWEALSDLFLDTELVETDFLRIARVLAASGYTAEETEAILYGEVYPACICNLNLFCVAGVWDGFDPDALQDRILIQRRKWWLKWRWCQWQRSLIREDWQRVREALVQLRASHVEGQPESLAP